MPPRDPDQYTQGDDGLIVEKVGSWAVEKLKIVTDYIYASGGARKKYLGTGAAYIDPFCAAGRSLVRDTTRFIDGSRSLHSNEPLNRRLGSLQSTFLMATTNFLKSRRSD